MNTKFKEFIRKSFALFPSYRIWKSRVVKSISNSRFERIIRRNINRVPYFNSYSELIRYEFNLQRLPIIRKVDVMGKENQLVSRLVNKRVLRTVETGGSTGCSLSLSRHWRDNLKETVFRDFAFSLIGKNLIVAVLRGNRPEQGLYEVVSKNRIVLSSYGLGNESLDQYMKILTDYKVSCIHAYPSSLVILARLIKRKYGYAELPFLKGILTSSEIFSREDKKLVQEVFPNVTLVDFYGHNEMACCAYSVNLGCYHFFPWYGHVEFKETGEFINGNRIAEIIATSIMNSTMPFIRYATDDYVELDQNNNIVSIIGRTSDFLVDRNSEIIPCILLTRNESLRNVTNFQFIQDRVGAMTFSVVVTEDFGNADKDSLLEDLHASFGEKIDCSLVVVPYIERTNAGKQKRLVQKLDIRTFM